MGRVKGVSYGGTGDGPLSAGQADAGGDPAAEARRLLRAAATASLATAARGTGGWPYASFALVAVDCDATPLLLLSDLAEHSRNIAADDRVSLLIESAAGLDDPLTGPRLSVLGRALRSAEPRHRARFLARHPSAEAYAGFGDFRVYRVAVERGHFVAGFGRIHDLARDELIRPAPPGLVDAAADIVARMNADHADPAALLAEALLGADGAGAIFTGIDPEGCDIRNRAGLLRLDFERPVADAAETRAALAGLVRRARTLKPGTASP
ncbi:MAG: HugZ family protein [Alphaproteobacteria bacterium]